MACVCISSILPPEKVSVSWRIPQGKEHVERIPEPGKNITGLLGHLPPSPQHSTNTHVTHWDVN